MRYLLENVSADVNGAGVESYGGSVTVSIWATAFGGGTVTLQASPDNGTTWIDLTIGGSAASFTANAVRNIDFLGPGMLIRATLSGSAGANGVYVAIT